MIRRSPLRLLAVAIGAVALFGCADTGPQAATYATKPTLVNGNKTFTDITGGDFHTCALQANGEAFCWGLNSQGQSGNGVSGGVGVNSPRVVIGGYLFASIHAGGSHTCGILLVGTTMCWGNNVGGQLGVGSTIDRFEPSPVAGDHAFIQVSASTLAHTCALKANGEAWCWGAGQYGRLGTGSETNRTSPTLVGGGIQFISIATGGGHSCGIAADSSAYCWGRNTEGQLGDGTNTNRLIPTKVAAPIKFKQIAAGIAHTCGISENGDPYCWGDNVVGALGDGTTNSRNTPTLVANGPVFESIVVGERHGCGLDANGTALCWGYNNEGELGDGTTETKTEPVALFTAIAFKKLAAGAYHTCGISKTNVTYCWGDNYGFQLGIPDPN